MNYYERHLGDYARDTGHLSALEHGVYTLLLDAYYGRERPLPSDLSECHRIAKAASRAEKEAVSYVLRQFFAESADGFRQGRADLEISRFKEKQRKASASANARWKHSERNANALPTQSEGNALQSPVTSNHDKTPKPPRTAKAAKTRLPDDFCLTPALTEYAKGQLPDSDPAALMAKFCEQARAKGWEYVDWRAAFQTYCRNARADSGHFSAGQYPRRASGANGIHAGVVMR